MATKQHNLMSGVDLHANKIDATTGTELTTPSEATYDKRWLKLYDVRAYGAVADGATDDTTAVNNAIAAAMTDGGGTVWIPGRVRCNGALVFPYTGPSDLPVQSPVRITGNGATWMGYWRAVPDGKSILDLRYDGTDNLHPAKIDTRGAGFLEIDNLTIMSGNDDFPIMQTTNTTVHLHHFAVAGNTNNAGGTTCTQTFLKLGGSGTTFGNASDAPFQGYGSKISDFFVSNISKVIVFGNDCNGIEVENVTVSKTCGSSSSTGAPFSFEAITGHAASGNRIKGGTVEITNYKYVVNMTANADQNEINVGTYDNNGYTLGVLYCGHATPVTKNLIFCGYLDPALQSSTLVGTGAANNYTIRPGTALPVTMGGTGSISQNFVDLTSTQTINGDKTFANAIATSRVNMVNNIPGFHLTTTAAGNKEFDFVVAYNDPTSFSIVDATAGGAQRLYIDTNGKIGLSNTNPTGILDVNDDHIRVRSSKTPASATAAGNAGDICWDASYVYICTATNTWKRVVIGTW